MRDPHVDSLRYRLVTDDGIGYMNPPAVEWETDAFRFRLENGIATIEMIEHYPSEQAAMERVQQYLSSYEAYVALHHHGSQAIHFEFDKAGTQIIDRETLRRIQVESLTPLQERLLRSQFEEMPRSSSVNIRRRPISFSFLPLPRKCGSAMKSISVDTINSRPVLSIA